MLAALLFSITAQAQVAGLSDPGVLLAPCLELPTCVDTLTPTLSQAMGDLGLALQHQPRATSALLGRGSGLVTELAVASTPGLPDDDPLAPVMAKVPLLPHLGLGYQIGSYTFDDPYPQFGVGLSGLPPVTVAGVQLWSLGGNLSAAVPVGGHVLWLGAELDHNRNELRGEMVSLIGGAVSDDTVSLVLDEVAQVCDGGCIDTLVVSSSGLRLGFALDPMPALTLYARGGAALVQQRLSLAIGGDWALSGVQGQLQSGVALRLDDKLGLDAGVTHTLRRGGLPGATRVVGGISFRWGTRMGVSPGGHPMVSCRK